MTKVIDLDDANERATLVLIGFRGNKIALGHARLLELLENEQERTEGPAPAALRRGTGAAREPVVAPAPAQAQASGSLEALARHIAAESVSHASLSSRIKKIHAQSVANREVRPGHLGLLREMIASFDWVIPEHPNTVLEQHLEEMAGWSSCPADFRADALAFLKRYLKARPDLRRR